MRWKQRCMAVLGAVALGAGVLAGPALAAGAASPGAAPVPPQDDPFYQPPAGFASTAPGTVLRSRPVTISSFSTLPQRVRAWQVLYRTTTYQGGPEATVTTVLAPEGVRPKALISYQIAEDAVAPQCALSYELRAGSGPGGAINQSELLLIDAAVADGFAVSVPDYEGPGGDFGAARQPGYAVLDGARAAEALAPLGLPGTSTPVGLWGYSGGSLASGWAAQDQPSYAPTLHLVGSALGGFVTNIGPIMENVNGGPGAGLIVSVLDGVARTVPALAAAIARYATPAGKAMLARGASQCETYNVEEYQYTNLDQDFTIPFDQFLTLPSVAPALARLALGSTAPTTPLFVYHAVHDELVPIAGVTATVDRYCAAGDAVTYTQDEASEHLSLTYLGGPAALSWLAQRLDGSAAPHGCTTTTVPSMFASASTLPDVPPFLLAGVTALAGLPVGPGVGG